MRVNKLVLAIKDYILDDENKEEIDKELEDLENFFR